MIGEDIEVLIVDVRGKKVRVGIIAPKSVPVHRKEVYQAIHHAKPEAAKVDAFLGRKRRKRNQKHGSEC